LALLRPCRNTAAFEIVPERELKLDLAVVEARLLEAGYRRVVRAGVMLIMRKDLEVSVYRSGKMLLKTRDPDAAAVLARTLRSLLLPEDDGPLRTEGFERLKHSATGGA
jgi:hypothetical protein